jgi:hypothetical protein
MRFKRKIKTIALSIGLCGVLGAGVALAATSGDSDMWSYSDYSHGSYVPQDGSMNSLFYDTYFTTQVDFIFDDYNVSKILDYNDGGDNPGTSCDNDEAYVTLDQSAIGDDSLDLEISASSVRSNLPDPKYDLESNGGVDNDESEVVALGSVSATSYYMRTTWDDYRDGDSGDSGKIQAQFAMSTKGLSDYNNCVQSDVVQATIYYGDNLGQP